MGKAENKDDEIKFVTSQKLLAKKVGCTNAHLSNVKAKRKNISTGLAKKIANEVGVSALLIATGRRDSIDKAFRKYFRSQKLAELASK